MPMPVDQKYVVIPLDLWNDHRNQFPPMEQLEMDEMMLRDAVVIRAHDTFAAPAFWSYAYSISTAVAALNVAYEMENPGSGSIGYLISQLQGIADYFAEWAEYAETIDTKLPD